MRKLLKKIPLNIQLILLGILAFIMNWKTWAFYIFLGIVFTLVLLDAGIVKAFMVIPIMFGLKWLGRLF